VRLFSAIVACVVAAGGAELPVFFHHIHVNDRAAGFLVNYYQKLFDPETTHPVTIGAFRGVEADGVLLLVTAVPTEAPEAGGAGWHFGWGTVALDEAYDRHRMQEIHLKLPMASFAKDLHVHLESEDPIAAAAWYRDRLGASIKTDASNAEVLPSNPLLRRPAAIVELSGITLALYKTSARLEPSRGHRIDHLAFRADLKQAKQRGFTVLQETGRLGPFETMTIEGPDRLAIELVGAPAFNRPSAFARLSRN
jgi:hypothetical protein